MKKRGTTLSIALIVLLGVSLVIAACGSGSETSTTGGAVTTATTVAGASSTTAGSAESTTSTAGSGTGTTTPGGLGGIPNSIAVSLTGGEEVPAVDTDATGTFTLTISMGSGGSASSATPATTAAGGGLLPAGLQVTYKLEVTNITDATAAHIHLGAKGQNGDVIYPLFTGPPKSGSFSGVLAEGPLNEADLTGPFKGKTFVDLVAVVLSGGTYVNVHTAANPNGEIRGQLIISLGATPSGAGAGAATATSVGSTSSSAGY